MAEEDRLAFLRAEGVEDWRVLYCGPVAQFACNSVQQAVAFAADVAALDVLATRPPLLDVRPDAVTVRLVADLWDLDAAFDAPGRARAVSALARARGLTPAPHNLQDAQIAIGTALPSADVLPFWRAVLGYADHVGDDLIDPHGRAPGIWFQTLDPTKPLRHAMHVDLAVPRDFAQQRVDAALAAGGRIADDEVAPKWWTFADPAGNKVDLVAWPDLPQSEGEPAQLEADATTADHHTSAVPADDESMQRGEAVWEAFRAASDLDDWPVLFTGPAAWFRTGSLTRSVDLAVALAALDGATRLHLDLRADGLTVRVARDFHQLETSDLDLAQRISQVAREIGAEPDPTQVQQLQITIASKPSDDVRPFWRELFGYVERGDEDLDDPQGRGPSLWFQQLDADKPLRHAFHIDLSVPRAVGRSRVDAALTAGGRIADDHAPNWWTLADPAGNKIDVAVWPDREPEPDR